MRAAGAPLERSHNIRVLFRRRRAGRGGMRQALSDPPVPACIRPREFLIPRRDLDREPFRPSDWAERLCGVMSCYRPGVHREWTRRIHRILAVRPPTSWAV